MPFDEGPDDWNGGEGGDSSPHFVGYQLGNIIVEGAIVTLEDKAALNIEMGQVTQPCPDCMLAGIIFFAMGALHKSVGKEGFDKRMEFIMRDVPKLAEDTNLPWMEEDDGTYT